MTKFEYDNPHYVLDEVLKLLQRVGYTIRYANGGSSEVGLLGIPEFPVIELEEELKKSHFKSIPKNWFSWSNKSRIMMEPFVWDEDEHFKALMELKTWANDLD